MWAFKDDDTLHYGELRPVSREAREIATAWAAFAVSQKSLGVPAEQAEADALAIITEHYRNSPDFPTALVLIDRERI